MKLPPETAAPAGAMTVIGPVGAPAGTTAPMVVLLVTTNPALVPPNCTLVAPKKFAPVIITLVLGPCAC